jgi:hypothetical protein
VKQTGHLPYHQSRPCGPEPRFLHPFAKPAAEDFITIVQGEGAAVWDAAVGRRRRAGQPLVLQRGARPGRHRHAIDAQMRTLENYNTFDIFTNKPSRG